MDSRLEDCVQSDLCIVQTFSVLVSRADREYVVEEDFMKAVRKVADVKKLETKLDYKPV